ncbi:serine/threonine protein phosphatase [Sulfurisphaera ohwakuensis]|uniref:Serine/threonine protein phosphatase n=2 Tax=Sulfurisphaera ohwakuensis TaxID=69656 RepID=A0A650CJU8_SULOH|nr:serine/threonine protein phosphatase [Sulfurisphaera ohwakuensis]
MVIILFFSMSEEYSKVLELMEEAKEIFKIQGPFAGEYKARRIAFVGDTHGAVDVTQYVFNEIFDKVDLLVFLGDYVDRYPPSGVENLMIILEKFLQNKDKVVILRGNHESPITNLYYGFYEEVALKFGNEKVYEKFKDFFSYIPYVAIVNNYFCVHGGLPGKDNGGEMKLGIHSVDEIKSLPYPDINPDDPIAFQLLWNDPREGLDDFGFLPNIRGEGTFYFGEKIVKEFLDSTGYSGIIRGHEAVDGFRIDINGKVITVFSSRYHGQSAGVLLMDEGKIKRVYLYQDGSVKAFEGL